MELNVDGFLSVELMTKPLLALALTTPEPEPKRYILPLDPATAQCLALELLQQVGYRLLPELAQEINAEAAKHAATDDAFLKSIGIADEMTMN